MDIEECPAGSEDKLRKPILTANGTSGASYGATKHSSRKYELLDPTDDDALPSKQSSPPPSSPEVTVKALSPLRKTCLVLSCFAIILFCVMFIYVLPCNFGPCRLTSPQSYTPIHDWEVTLPSVDLSTNVYAVPTSIPGSFNVVFGYQTTRSVADPNTASAQHPLAGGLTVLDAGKGHQLWKYDFHETPRSLLCDQIHPATVGRTDCIVTGSRRMVAMVDVNARDVLWFLHGHNLTSDITALAPPVLIPDQDDDDYMDLITACSVNVTDVVLDRIIVASGRTGKVLGQPVVLDNCSNVTQLRVHVGILILHCSDRSEAVNLTLDDVLLSAFTNTNFTPQMRMKLTAVTPLLPRATVENSGACPRCDGDVHLRSADGSQTLWTYHRPGAHIYSPAVFKRTDGFGIIFKEWKYPDRPSRRRGPRSSVAVPSNVVRELTERVVVVHYIDGEYVARNISVHQVVQMCSIGGPSISCVPREPADTQSIIVGDVDGDNDLDLVSVTSTYVIPNPDVSSGKRPWAMNTIVKKHRLLTAGYPSDPLLQSHN